MYYWEETFVTRAFDPWTVFSLVVLLLMLHGVWRMWRGMRLDGFERGLRTMRQRPGATLVFSEQRSAAGPRTGWLQVSLLPLMLLSTGAALMLAQAQRPDHLSRPVTWALFVGVGTWYGLRARSNSRGLGPLRNYAWAGVVNATILSAILWAFYLAVDLYWGNGVGRLNSSFAVLLWWTAVAAAVGGTIGALRANRRYAQVRTETTPGAERNPTVANVSITAPPRRRQIAWGAVVMACSASFLVHCSAVPHLNQVVKYRWYWHDFYHWDRPRPNMSNVITLTALPSARPDRWAAVTLQPHFSSGYAPGTVSAGNTQPNAAVGYEVPMVATMTKSVPANTLITSEMLTQVVYDGDATGVIEDVQSAVGKISIVPLTAGQAVMQNQLAIRPLDQSENGIFYEPFARSRPTSPKPLVDGTQSNLLETGEVAIDVQTLDIPSNATSSGARDKTLIDLTDVEELSARQTPTPSSATTVLNGVAIDDLVDQIAQSGPGAPVVEPEPDFSEVSKALGGFQSSGFGRATQPPAQSESTGDVTQPIGTLVRQLESTRDSPERLKETEPIGTGEVIEDGPSLTDQPPANDPAESAQQRKLEVVASRRNRQIGATVNGPAPQPLLRRPGRTQVKQTPAAPQPPPATTPNVGSRTNALVIVKSDGGVVTGTVISQNAQEIKLQTKSGVVTIRRSEIEALRKEPRFNIGPAAPADVIKTVVRGQAQTGVSGSSRDEVFEPIPAATSGDLNLTDSFILPPARLNSVIDEKGPATPMARKTRPAGTLAPNPSEGDLYEETVTPPASPKPAKVIED